MPVGHIYKILNTIDDDVYIGSTVSQLCKRMVDHRCKSKLLPSNKYPCQIHIKMNELGKECFYIELIKNYDDITRDELLAKEGKYIRYYKENYTKGGILNKRIEKRTDEQYRIDNKNDINKKGRGIYKLGKEKENETGHKYREDEIEKHKIWVREVVNCECGKTSTRGHLARHKKGHNGPDYVECKDCDMKYTKSNKISHYEAHHKKGHNGPEYVECEDCDMKYTKSNKINHYRRNHPKTTTE